MVTLAEFRKSYPQYDDMDDETLARALHGKHYSDMSFEDFSAQIQYTPLTSGDGPDLQARTDFGREVLSADSTQMRPSIEELSEGPARDAHIAKYGTHEEQAERLRQGAARQTSKVDEMQQRERDTLNVDYIDEGAPVRSASPFGGFLGLPTAKEKEQRVAEVGKRARRMIEIGEAEPEDYGLSQEFIDEVEEDRVQNYFNEQKADQDKAAWLAENGYIDMPEGEDAEVKSRWAVVGNVLKSLPARMLQDFKVRDLDEAQQQMQEQTLGEEYLRNVAKTYDDIGPRAQEQIEEVAAKYGVDAETYYHMTGQRLQDAADEVIAEVELAGEMEAEAFKGLPEIENFSDNPLGYLGNLAVQGTDSAAIMALGFATRNPHVVATLFGTYAYNGAYVNARANGRSQGQATMDAMYSAAIEGITEGIPVGRILGRAGKSMSRTRKVFQGIADEALQEMLVEAMQLGYDAGVVGEDMTMGEAFTAIRDAGILGGMMGGGFSAPFALTGDIEMDNANRKIKEASNVLRGVTMRMQDPGQRMDAAEVKSAQEGYKAAVQAKQKLIEQREAAEEEKQKAKEEKRKAKMSAKQKRRLAAAEKRAGEEFKVEGAPTEEQLEFADLVDKVAERNLTEGDVEAVEKLLDDGYARVTPSGNVMLLPTAQRRRDVIRGAQKVEEARKEKEDTEPEFKPYESPEAAEARVQREEDESIRRIADAILKEEQESVAFAEREEQRAREQEARRDKDYSAALRQLRKEEETDVGEGLVAMDEKSISGYQGTRLGDVLRDAMKTLEREEAKAKEALLDAFWNKPTQGQLFDVTGVLAKGTKDYANVVKVGALKLAKIGLKYGAWSADMVGEFGESIKPVLSKIYADSKKRVRDVMRISHEKFKTGPRAGKLKYAPSQFADAKGIRRLRAQLEKLAKEGEIGRMWYERTGERILEVTGQNVSEARKLAGLLAIYSSGTAVGANLTNALKMWADFKAGDLKMPKRGTKAGRFTEQDRLAIEWLKSSESDSYFVEKFGEKRFPFFTNIMRAIDPEMYELGQGATVDLWMMRAFGYHTPSPTDPQNAFAATEIQNIADKMGWEKQQAQAAIWVAIKARWEYIQKAAKERAVAEGKAELIKGAKGAPVFNVLGSTREEQLEFEKDIITIFREEAMRVSLTELNKKLEESAQDFADYMERHYAVMSWEAEPSTTLGLDINKMPLEAKMELQAEVAQLLTNPKTGREYVAEWLGLLGADQFIGPGAWELNIGSATQNTLLVPPQHKAKGAEASKNAAEAMDGMAAIYGFLLRQDGVAWHRPFYASSMKASNGAEIISKTLTPGQTKALYVAIVAEAAKDKIEPNVAMEWAPIVLEGATRVLNFTDVPNRQFHKIIERAANRAGINGSMELFESAGNFIGNDWTLNKKGESYVDQISNNQNPAVQTAFARAKRKFRKPLKDIYAKYAKRYDADATQPARAYPKGQEPKLAKGSARFRHFSKAEPDVIKVDKFGTGIKGAERLRNPVPVISAYPDKGFKKEVGLGPNEYVIDARMSDLYNVNEDPLDLKSGAKEPTTFNANMKPVGWRTDMSKMEALIKEAGYAGYYTPDASGNLKGQARFFVDIPVEGANVASEINQAFGMYEGGPSTIEIRENELDEFEVPNAAGGTYYTDDIDDAIGTARREWGDDVSVNILDEFGDLVDTVKPEPRQGKKPPVIKVEQTPAEARENIESMLEEFFEETDFNPLSPDLRTFNGNTQIELSPQGGFLWIDLIAAIRGYGEGAGSKALDFVVDMADRHGVPLKLFAEPLDVEGGGLNRAALVAWYKDRGFAFDGNVMYRLPQPPKDVRQTFMWKTPPVGDEGLGVPVETVEKIHDDFATKLDLPRDLFRAIQTPEQLPPDARRVVAEHGMSGKVLGMYYNDPFQGPTIYSIAGNAWHQSVTTNGKMDGPVNEKFGQPNVPAMVENTIHEVLGHFGLRAFLGEKRYGKFMDQIRRAFPEEVKKRGKGMSEQLFGRRLAAEEVFAYKIQEELIGLDLRKVKTTLLDRILSEFKLILAQLGLRKITDQDMIDMMWRVTEYTRKTSYDVMKKRVDLVRKLNNAQIAIDNQNEEKGIELTLGTLKTEREADPDLDRFLNKISHGKSQPMTKVRDWWLNIKDNWSEIFEREIFDQYASIKRREKEMGIFGTESGYVSVRLSAGVDVMIRSAIEHGVPVWKDGWVAIDESQMGLLEVLAPIAQNAEMLKMFEAFIVARRAYKLKKENRDKLFESEEISSVYKYLRKNKLYTLFDQTQKDLNAWKTGVLDFAQEAGLIDPESRKLWERADHVPFYRVLTQNDKVGPFAASRIGHIRNPIRRLTGQSTAPLRKPLDSIVQNISMLMEAAVKNKAMTDVVNNFKGSGVVTKAPQAVLDQALIPLDQIQDRLDEAGVSIDAVGRDMLKGISKVTSITAPTDENIVSIMENGKKQYYFVHDPGIMRGLEGVTPTQWSWLMRLLRTPKRWFTWSITRMPDFILKNLFRDMFHAYALSRRANTGVIYPVVDTMRGWSEAIAQDATFREMMAGGGVFQAGYVNASDPGRTDTAIRSKILTKGRHGIIDTPKKLWQFYVRLADGAENAHRVGVYRKTLKKTGSRKMALFESRDLMDFSVRGRHPVIRFLVETVPFWGARVQGIQRTGKGFREQPMVTLARALPLVFASVALYLMNRDDERYMALAPHDKRMYYHFYDVFTKGDHYRLPKPFEVGSIFSTIPEILTEAWLSEEPDRLKHAGQALSWVAWEMVNLAPDVQLAMPIYELAINENTFTEAPILNARLKELPPEGQYTYRTPPTFKALADAMPASAPDALRSPKQLEHLVRGYFGSIVDYALVASDYMYYQMHQDVAQPPEMRWDEMPFVKSFKREETEKYDIYVEEMYNVLEEADKIYNQVQKLRKEGDPKASRALKEEERALLFARQRMSGAKDKISDINAQIRKVYLRENLSPSAKRERIDELLKRRHEQAKRVYDYRPGGSKNRFEGGEESKSYYEATTEFLNGLIGQSKEEQVDQLISAQLPHTATLINDVTISDDKLEKVA